MPALRTRRTRRSPRFRAALAFAALAGVLSAGVASGGTAAAKESAASPTDGWTQTSFTYSMHKPWNLDLSERYGYNSSTKTHTMWVNSTDEPLEEGSDTDPRTEMRWKQEYSSGKHMWDADVYVPSGTNGADIMQILRGKHPSGTPATDIMLRASSANGGTLKRYTDAVIKTGIYNTWWNLKVAHDADAGKIQVYADDKLVLTVDDRGPATRYFKNGVYHHGSGRAEARFRNIRHWVK
ncbi:MULTISPECIES: polysaccharide lyase family 7 protein [Streptomyces]|uniref:polysaccharide lyase family 7 protein n=1 Tax=Streptomyces TaxID=1883 RepID=UPI002030FE6E|nr:polysaccharide lyase family 7 protein [Streptomyces rhizosphaericus]